MAGRVFAYTGPSGGEWVAAGSVIHPPAFFPPCSLLREHVGFNHPSILFLFLIVPRSCRRAAPKAVARESARASVVKPNISIILHPSTH